MTDKDATRRSRRRGIDACVQGQLVGCRGKAVCLLRGAHDRESTGTHTDTPSYTPCASNFNSPACRKGQKAKVRWRRPARLLLPLTTYRYTQGLGARAVFLPGPGLLPVHRLLTPGTRETPCNLFRFRRSQIHVYCTCTSVATFLVTRSDMSNGLLGTGPCRRGDGTGREARARIIAAVAGYSGGKTSKAPTF